MTREDFPFFVTQQEDGSTTLTWDSEHPVTSVFNDWTEEQFMSMILEACARVIEEHGQ